MATKMYVTSDDIGTNLQVPAAVSGASFAAGWEGTMAGGTVFHLEMWASLTNIHARPNSANVNKLIKSGTNTTNQERYGMRTYLGPFEAGTFTGSQAIEAGIMGAHGATFGFHWLTCTLRWLHEDGSVGKEASVLATSTTGIYANDNSFPATTYSSRHDTGTSAATNYTIVAGDWLVCEWGCHYETSSTLDLSFKVGDGNASDITSTDSTTVRNPFVQVDDDLPAIMPQGSHRLMLMGCGT